MSEALTETPEFKDTMARLESLKRKSSEGTEFWMAREIHAILGYPDWAKFEPVIERATQAFTGNHIDPSHHIAQTSKMMGIGGGGKRAGTDFFLSRVACYLIAMNGDPAKPEIAAAQAYFAIQTRRAELHESGELTEDEKRLELRSKVAQSFKMVSGVAQDAGVSSPKQALFHDARYHGLYGMSGRDVKRRKGLGEKENIFDHAGPLELSANDFQMNLAAEVIKNEKIRGESRVIATNKEVGLRVRKAIKDSNATLPEDLPLEEPIKTVRKRVEASKKLPRE